jgi:hypothetical protein
MSTEITGRAERPQKKGVKTALAAAVVLGAGMALPVIGAGTANAATIDEWERPVESSQWRQGLYRGATVPRGVME